MYTLFENIQVLHIFGSKYEELIRVILDQLKFLIQGNYHR